MNTPPAPNRSPSLKLSPPVLLVVIISIAIFLMRQDQQNAENQPEGLSPTETESTLAPASNENRVDATSSPIPKTESETKSSEFLTEVDRNTFKSPAGLIYRSGSADGHRIDHILQHAEDNPQKPIHGVFNGNREEIFALIDEAWTMSQKRGPPDVQQKNERGRTVITVNMKKKIGYVGGESGKRKGHPACTKIRLVLEKDSVITAYPMQ